MPFVCGGERGKKGEEVDQPGYFHNQLLVVQILVGGKRGGKGG